ncbi:hypothetical protein L3476_21650 [Paenibacillus thiaminolyticus]|uniref:acyl carrier protein n=1 Tax=Paenibacillus thiaminolyticus TaxID=49283 RepID=UPI0011622BF2|nr:acyl carrier protein [Paenibacillus thiaminolyticus]NGP60488.1 acyl carrier protein [Paenibacillus thiaminolyticus]WCR25875.1 hypothetical protein L3476_21650 [Paenibacillus thiaminolyticus]
MMNNGEVYAIIIEAAEAYNSEGDIDAPIDYSQGKETPLYGKDGVLDSLALVNFVVLLEQQLEDHFDVNIQIVSDKAMSQKTSPFLTIGTLSDFVESLIRDNVCSR